MKSMTIHGVDEQLEKMIRAKAEAEGLSINKTIKNLLAAALGIKPRPSRKNLNEFKKFHGLWSKEDLKAFTENTCDLRTVDRQDWQ